MLKGKRLLDYANSFSRKGYGKNDKIIRCVISGEYRKFKNSKMSYISEKISVLFIICSKCRNEDEKTFKEEEY